MTNDDYKLQATEIGPTLPVPEAIILVEFYMHTLIKYPDSSHSDNSS